jgi:hypothetical protein
MRILSPSRPSLLDYDTHVEEIFRTDLRPRRQSNLDPILAIHNAGR